MFFPYVREPESVNFNPLSSELSGPNAGQMVGSDKIPCKVGSFTSQVKSENPASLEQP